jgi:hypothetical protein
VADGTTVRYVTTILADNKGMLNASVPLNSCANRLFDRPHPIHMIRKLKSGEFRLYSRKKDAKTGKRKNLGTFSSLAAAKKHERAVQYFKRAA